MIHVQETMAHKYNKRRRMSPTVGPYFLKKGTPSGSADNVKICCDKTCPYWDRSYEVAATKTTSILFKSPKGD